MTEERKAQISHALLKCWAKNYSEIFDVKLDVLDRLEIPEQEMQEWAKDLFGATSEDELVEHLDQFILYHQGPKSPTDEIPDVPIGHIFCPECKEGVLRNIGGILKCSVCTLTHSTGSDMAPPEETPSAETHPICGECGHSIIPKHDMGGIVRCPNCNMTLSAN